MPKKHPPSPVTLFEHGDEHWYTQDGTFYVPSVSTVLSALKDGLEFVSPYDLKRAADRGIKVHKATEDLEAGKTLEKMFFTEQEWDMLGGFVSWHKVFQPTTVLSESRLASKKLGFGGTLDRLYLLVEGNTLVDIKTTSTIYDKHWLQVAAYAKLAKEHGHKVERTAILRLTDRSKAKYQYEVHEDWTSDYKIFEKHLAVWKYLNADRQPKRSELPNTLSLHA